MRTFRQHINLMIIFLIFLIGCPVSVAVAAPPKLFSTHGSVAQHLPNSGGKTVVSPKLKILQPTAKTYKGQQIQIHVTFPASYSHNAKLDLELIAVPEPKKNGARPLPQGSKTYHVNTLNITPGSDHRYSIIMTPNLYRYIFNKDASCFDAKFRLRAVLHSGAKTLKATSDWFRIVYSKRDVADDSRSAKVCTPGLVLYNKKGNRIYKAPATVKISVGHFWNVRTVGQLQYSMEENGSYKTLLVPSTRWNKNETITIYTYHLKNPGFYRFHTRHDVPGSKWSRWLEFVLLGPAYNPKKNMPNRTKPLSIPPTGGVLNNIK